MLPPDSKAEPMEMTVMEKEPLCVDGMPSYMNCMLLDLLTVRVAMRSILRSLMGSSVAFICKSVIEAVVAGVVMLELSCMSQPLRAALSM